jgi:hypothetical protein
MFVHDINDILLEYTKCHSYLKNRNGMVYAWNEFLSNIGFVVFTISWYVLNWILIFIKHYDILKDMIIL